MIFCLWHDNNWPFHVIQLIFKHRKLVLHYTVHYSVYFVHTECISCYILLMSRVCVGEQGSFYREVVQQQQAGRGDTIHTLSLKRNQEKRRVRQVPDFLVQIHLSSENGPVFPLLENDIY